MIAGQTEASRKPVVFQYAITVINCQQDQASFMIPKSHMMFEASIALSRTQHRILVYLALNSISFSLDCISSAEEIDSHSRKNRTVHSIWFGSMAARRSFRFKAK